MQKAIGSVWLGTVCALALGCGGDDGGGLGVSSSKQVGDLSPAEAKQVCAALQTKLTKVAAATAELECTATAYATASGHTSTCETARASCIADATKNPDQNFDLECGTASDQLNDCGNVTVGDLNACADALSAQVTSEGNKLTCNSSPADFQNISSSSPDECTKLDTSCPMLAGDNS